ncbi:hypothetical protein KM427_18425 [Nocardioides sp. LMS-CY]|uniref:DUF5994 family protein n=1 Tax=Nocardioides sp. (strain LMS-CY) TaxID=2840457 RepID=UPI001BFFDF96|nr:DUF5994 family protein [Nocardioides sp. LMS-CY]QWF20919.1 hypothetical protein KM427_18425 [Nocardioides sp. LMS-CY]
MTTSPRIPTAVAPTRSPLRLHLEASADGRTDGTWWPQSRDLQSEAADLVDRFPVEAGYINRLLFSRPDWDDSSAEGRGVRRIQARRGPVKVGSFPRDDTHLMVLSMSTGERLRIEVIPSATEAAEGARLMRGGRPVSTPTGADRITSTSMDTARWDNESPAG